MECQLTYKTHICSEPPVLQKIRSSLSTSVIILASILGFAATLLFPLFFKIKAPAGNIQNIIKTLLITDYAMFLPNAFLFLSALILCVKFKNQLTVSASTVFPLYFFIAITPLTCLCIYYFEFLNLGNQLTNTLKTVIAAVITVLIMIIHILAAESIKTAIKRNLPKRAFVFTSALLFLTTMLLESAYMVYRLIFELNANSAVFNYSDYIGTALFATFTATSAVMITIKLITLYFSIGKVKRFFKQTSKENL